MSDNDKRVRQKAAFARFQARKKEKRQELETRLNTLIFYSSGTQQDNLELLSRENTILQKQFLQLELENIVLRSKQQPAREIDCLNMAKAPAPRPSRIDTLMIPEIVPSSLAPKTPVSTLTPLTDDFLILLGI
jgi:hypothetical protein